MLRYLFCCAGPSMCCLIVLVLSSIAMSETNLLNDWVS